MREAFHFDAGQFVELSIFGVGEAPISISSAPSKQGFIELCVRNAGDVTGALHRKQCGDIVGLRGPFGRGFPFEEMKGHDVLLVAGGLGIAPLKSLINHIHDERHDFGKVTILLRREEPGRDAVPPAVRHVEAPRGLRPDADRRPARRDVGRRGRSGHEALRHGSTSTRTTPTAPSAVRR